MPRVSVIIPTFNCGKFLGQAVATVLAQTFTDYEIIVVDDGSIDDTQDVVASFGSKAHYFYQPNAGHHSARNLGLSKASGDLIAHLDADDMWYPHKLERQVAFLDAHGEYGLVHSNATIIDESDAILSHTYWREAGRDVAQGYCTLELLQRNSICFPTVLERRNCIECTSKFDERLKTAGDYLHWILVAMEGIAFGYIDEPLTMYRRRTGSLSTNERQMSDSLVRIFEILLAEKSLALRCGQEAAAIARARLHTLQWDLAYLDRIEGRTGQARQRILRLLQQSPLRTDLYVELLKSCVPAAMAIKLRKLRRRWT